MENSKTFTRPKKKTKQKADINIMNPDSLKDQPPCKALLVDVSFPCPVTGSAVCTPISFTSRAAALKVGRQVNETFKEKQEKYDGLIVEYAADIPSIIIILFLNSVLFLLLWIY
jgi:hypothetical protein